MKNFFLLLLVLLSGCSKFAPEPDPFYGYNSEIPKSESISVNGVWKIASGYRIEKYQGLKDSIKVNFLSGVSNKIYNNTNESFDNVVVAKTTWMFTDTDLYYNSLDRYSYKIQLNKTIDIQLSITKRLFYIQTLNITTLIVKSGTQYSGINGENGNYSVLEFKKIL